MSPGVFRGDEGKRSHKIWSFDGNSGRRGAPQVKTHPTAPGRPLTSFPLRLKGTPLHFQGDHIFTGWALRGPRRSGGHGVFFLRPGQRGEVPAASPGFQAVVGVPEPFWGSWGVCRILWLCARLSLLFRGGLQGSPGLPATFRAFL